MICKTLKEFGERWGKICKKVEGKSFDRNQAQSIADDFLNEVIIFGGGIEDKEEKNLIQTMIEISNDLNISLQIAISNYERFAKPSLLKKIFGDQFKPQINLDINAVKNKL